MNKIVIDDKEISVLESDGKLSSKIYRSNKLFDVYKVKINITNDTDLVIECDNSDIKYEMVINVLTGVKANIYEFKDGGICKSQYNYHLDADSYLNVERVIDVKNINDMVVINLDGENAKIEYSLKTICKDDEKYNYLVYHNASKTFSDIVNNGVNILDGKLEFNVSSFVPNNIKKCYVNQGSRIINMTDNICTIKPNLFIDEEDVIANHSALIGTFSFDEIFYLMSRGISKKEADSLLTEGFLMKGINYHKDNLEAIIDKYWR